MNTAAEIFEIASRLSSIERAALARQLLLSLEDDPFDDDWEAAWADELSRRADRLEKGEVSLSDWDDALTSIRRSLEERAISRQ